jgi:hypothetical protein
MEMVSLHPIEERVVVDYVATLQGTIVDARVDEWFGSPARSVLDRAAAGSEPAINQITTGVAQALARVGPLYASQPFGLSFWEAQVDRSMGLLMRPPARLFLDAGFDRRVARGMPIRLVAQGGMMGGAWIPARLIPEALAGLEDHLERSARRLQEAELDPFRALELMYTALTHAREKGQGLFEAQDLVVPGMAIPGLTILGPDAARLPAALQARIHESIAPPRKPGLFDRLLRRVDAPQPPASNGHFSDVTIVEHHDRAEPSA